MATADVYSENFDDGSLDYPWSSDGINYEITEVPEGSLGLKMNEGKILSNGVISSEVGSYFDEFVDHFEADIFLPSEYSNSDLGIDLWWIDYDNWPPDYGNWPEVIRTDVTLIPEGEFHVNFAKDGEVMYHEIFDSGNLGEGHKLSITYFEDFIRVGIDDNEKDYSFEWYEAPVSPVRGYCSVHGTAPEGADPALDIEYYTDNILARTRPVVTIDSVVDSIEDWVERGELEGSGGGKSADNRLNALENMLYNAQLLFESGDTVGGCDQLASAYKKCDGEPHPVDFVQGNAAEELAGQIQTLMTDFECE